MIRIFLLLKLTLRTEKNDFSQISKKVIIERVLIIKIENGKRKYLPHAHYSLDENVYIVAQSLRINIIVKLKELLIIK